MMYSFNDYAKALRMDQDERNAIRQAIDSGRTEQLHIKDDRLLDRQDMYLIDVLHYAYPRRVKEQASLKQETSPEFRRIHLAILVQRASRYSDIDPKSLADGFGDLDYIKACAAECLKTLIENAVG